MKESIATEMKINDFATKNDLMGVKLELKSDIKNLEVAMHKSFTEMTKWIIVFFTTVVGIAFALAKLVF